jgi:hypothetical protein
MFQMLPSRVPKTVRSIVTGVVLLTGGCEPPDERLADFARQSTEQQAQQNEQMAEQSRQIAEGSRQLIEADAQARQEIVSAQQQLQDQQVEIGHQRDALKPAGTSPPSGIVIP